LCMEIMRFQILLRGARKADVLTCFYALSRVSENKMINFSGCQITNDCRIFLLRRYNSIGQVSRIVIEMLQFFVSHLLENYFQMAEIRASPVKPVYDMKLKSTRKSYVFEKLSLLVADIPRELLPPEVVALDLC